MPTFAIKFQVIKNPAETPDYLCRITLGEIIDRCTVLNLSIFQMKTCLMNTNIVSETDEGIWW